MFAYLKKEGCKIIGRKDFIYEIPQPINEGAPKFRLGSSFMVFDLMTTGRCRAHRPGKVSAKKLYGPNPVFVQVLFQGFRKNLTPDFNRP
jgi:hypothetical protein